MLPAFLQTKGLIKQHLDSFNYFMETDIKKIILANNKVDSDVDPHFSLVFTDIRIRYLYFTSGETSNYLFTLLYYFRTPEGEDQRSKTSYPLTPHDCRLRDMTYAGSIFVDIEYTRGKTNVRKRNIEIGKVCFHQIQMIR